MGKSGYTCVRHVFCWLNLLIWISGCLLVAGGIYLRVYYPGKSTMLPQYSWAGGDSLLIGVGVICFLAAFLGCCGSWVQSRCMLVTYFSIVVVLLCGEFIGASLGYLYRDSIAYHIKSSLEVGVDKHYNNTENNLIPIWDHIQKELKCCGIKSYEDWYQINSWPLERRVPDSCCKDSVRIHEGCGAEDRNLWWEEACGPRLVVWITERLHYAGIIGFLVAFIQLFGLISSMILFCTVRHKRSSRTYKSYQPAS